MNRYIVIHYYSICNKVAAAPLPLLLLPAQSRNQWINAQMHDIAIDFLAERRETQHRFSVKRDSP